MTTNHSSSFTPFSYRLFSFYRAVTHFVTSRNGGVSGEPYHSLNLGFQVGDDSDAVLENRAIVCEANGINPQSLTVGEQVHEARVAVVDEKAKGCGALDASTRLLGIDAMISKTPRIPLLALIADCAAIGLYDHRQKAIGLVHAGWRGTAAGIVQRTLEKMEEVFDSKPADIIASISPSIGPCCYEVGEDVIESFRKEFPEAGDHFFSNKTKDKAHLNLWQANKWQLLDAGVKISNVEVAELCTVCHRDMFYSHRAEQGRTGRFGALIMIR